MQQFLKAVSGLARARVLAPQLLDQLLVPVDGAVAALDVRLRRESLPAFTRPLERRAARPASSVLPWEHLLLCRARGAEQAGRKRPACSLESRLKAAGNAV